MTNEQHKLMYYLLRRSVGLLGVGFYILWVAGIFEDGVTKTSWKFSLVFVVGWFAITFIKDYAKHVMDEDIIKPKQRGIMVGLQGLIPWIIALVIAGGIKIGIGNLFTHLLVISLMQIAANIFAGYEEYYRMLIKKAAKEVTNA